MTTKVPTIPPVGGGDVDYILTNIKMLLDVREGRAGDSLDANVTYRDLVSLGLAKDPAGQVIYTGQNASSGIPVRPFGVDADGYDPTADLTPPPAPVNVEALGSIGVVFLSWSVPQYRNHSYAEIWRSGVNDLGTATLIGTASSQGFIDSPGDNLARYYWIRFVSRADVRGPYSQESVSAAASIDPAVLVSAIQGQVSESSLSQSLSSRIQRIEGDVNSVSSIQQTVASFKGIVDGKFTTLNASVGNVSAAITAETAARANADTALATDITNLQTTVAANTAAITTESAARTTADQAISTSLSTLSATVATNTTNIATNAASITTNAAAITAEAEARANGDSALATSISTLSASVASNTSGVSTNAAAIATESTARANADSALSTSISTLSATVDGFNTLISNEATARANADGTLFAQYTVKIDQNGFVSGYGLASETVNGKTTSDFQVRADRFAVVNPSVSLTNVSSITRSNLVATLTTSSNHGLAVGDTITVRGVTNDTAWNSSYTVASTPSSTQITFAVPNTLPTTGTGTAMKVSKLLVPFVVDGGVVYIADAAIKNASITDAKISTLTANKITAGNINATVGINGGKIYGGQFYAGGTVTVENDGSFTANNPTVKIDGGNVTVVAGSLRVSNSATGTPTDYTPFEVVNDVVYIKAAMIKDAAITLAKIDTATITNLSSIKADMGTITAGKMQSNDGKFVIDLDNKTISIEV
jgi:hypothetical protein